MRHQGAKEHPSMENNNVLNRNFDLSVIDHIGQSLQTYLTKGTSRDAYAYSDTQQATSSARQGWGVCSTAGHACVRVNCRAQHSIEHPER